MENTYKNIGSWVESEVAGFLHIFTVAVLVFFDYVR